MVKDASTDRQTRIGNGLALLLTLAAVAFFLFVYVPNRQQAEQIHDRSEQLRARVRRLHTWVRAMEHECAALRARDPEAVREAIRAVLRKGPPGEYVPAD